LARNEPRLLGDQESHERVHIVRVLSKTGGKKMRAARLLRIDIKTLNKKIKDYGIPLLR
jgi:DNA-binding NtrC family response regulator